jgi:hypothetical protein
MKPLEPTALHPPRRSWNDTCNHIETPANSLRHGNVQLIQALVDPQFLLRSTHSDKQQVRAAAIDFLNDGLATSRK